MNALKNILNTLSNIYWWADRKREIQSFFNPRQKWLTKKIPNQWCDKVELLKLVAFESIVHFVEEEKCFEANDWEFCDSHKEYADKIKFAYNRVKIDLPALKEQEEKAFDIYMKKYPMIWEQRGKEEGLITERLIHNREGEETAVKQWMELGSLYEKTEQETCELIMSLRQILWT